MTQNLEMIMMQSESVNELFTALSKAQSKMKPAIKDSENPYYGSNFSSLSACWDAAREALTENGLSVIQTPFIDKGQSFLLSTLAHSSGQFIRSMTPLLMARNDAQSFGAAVTYFRRFSLCALVGICPEDDDGEKERQRLAKEEERLAKEEERRRKEGRPSPEQVRELNSILNECDPAYKETVKVAFQSRNWSSAADMDMVSYNNLRNRAVENMKQFKEISSKIDQVVDAVEE